MVTVYKVIASNTVEENILKMQETKSALADNIISGNMNQLQSMSKDDFISLLEQSK